MDNTVRIVVDAMGGDRAPRVVVEGAVLAAKEYDHKIILVGDTRKIEKFLRFCDYPKDKLSIEHASQKVDMGEAAAVSIRKKRDSSIAVGLNLLKEKKADVFISAGNTGAVVAASAIKLRLLDGVERPGIAIVFPTLNEPTLLIDAGANIDTRPLHLYQYAVMGSEYSKYILGNQRPTVGLLNIGEEESKGTGLIKSARDILEKSDLNFIGNVEARDIYTGKVNVVVCEGFIGNVVLKVTEGFAVVYTELLKRELKRRFLPRIGAVLSIPAYRAIKKKIDYSEYGGAPLMGVDGAVIISHGASNAKAIKNAVRVAGEYVKHRVNDRIIEKLKANAKIVEGICSEKSK